MSEDLVSSVSPGEVLASVKTLHGSHVTLSHYEVQRATSSVQGFTSLMLRVAASVRLDRHTSTTTSLIVKRLPMLQDQADMFSQMNVFEKEVAYFDQAVPVLLSRAANLPLPRCFYSYGTTVVMEDLCEAGYRTLAKSMIEITQNDIVTMPLARLVMRKLALLHTASLDVAWSGKMADLLKVDTMFEGNSVDFIKHMFDNGTRAIVQVMEEMYPGKYKKHADWLRSPAFFETMRKFSKAKPNNVNVLCHGDCWLNNMMFKMDPVTNHPLDMKFIDLQVFRYATPVLDILYFLYLCTNKAFRDDHEMELLRAYVDAFNVHVCETPDRLTFEKCQQLYEEHRMFGLGISLSFRPMTLLDSVFPTEDQPLTSDKFDSMMNQDHTAEVVNKFRSDEFARSELSSMINETIAIIDTRAYI